MLATGLYKRLIAGYRLELARRTCPPRAGAAAARQGVARAAERRPRDDRVIPVPPPHTLRARDVPPLPARRCRTDRRASGRRRQRSRDDQRHQAGDDARGGPRDDRARSRGELSRRAHRNPDRVFLDLRGAGPRPGLRATQTFKDGAVRQIRVGQRPDNSTRVVLEVDGAARHSVFALYDPYRAGHRLRAAGRRRHAGAGDHRRSRRRCRRSRRTCR